jgi:hypothetical protein
MILARGLTVLDPDQPCLPSRRTSITWQVMEMPTSTNDRAGLAMFGMSGGSSSSSTGTDRPNWSEWSYFWDPAAIAHPFGVTLLAQSALAISEDRWQM